MSLCEHADRALSIETLYPEHRTDKIGGKWSIASHLSVETRWQKDSGHCDLLASSTLRLRSGFWDS